MDPISVMSDVRTCFLKSGVFAYFLKNFVLLSRIESDFVLLLVMFKITLVFKNSILNGLIYIKF